MVRRSLKAFAVFTASWPVMASTTKSVSWGLIAFFTLAISCIICSSIAKRPAVSTITAVKPCCFACAIAFCAMLTGFLFSRSLKTGIFNCLPRVSNWSMAAGRYTSQATSNGRLPFLRM